MLEKLFFLCYFLHHTLSVLSGNPYGKASGQAWRFQIHVTKVICICLVRVRKPKVWLFWQRNNACLNKRARLRAGCAIFHLPDPPAVSCRSASASLFAGSICDFKETDRCGATFTTAALLPVWHSWLREPGWAWPSGAGDRAWHAEGHGKLR